MEGHGACRPHKRCPAFLVGLSPKPCTSRGWSFTLNHVTAPYREQGTGQVQIGRVSDWPVQRLNLELKTLIQRLCRVCWPGAVCAGPLQLCSTTVDALFPAQIRKSVRPAPAEMKSGQNTGKGTTKQTLKAERSDPKSACRVCWPGAVRAGPLQPPGSFPEAALPATVQRQGAGQQGAGSCAAARQLHAASTVLGRPGGAGESAANRHAPGKEVRGSWPVPQA